MNRTESNLDELLGKLITQREPTDRLATSRPDALSLNEGSEFSDEDAEWFQGFESRLKIKISAEMARRLVPERKAIEKKLLEIQPSRSSSPLNTMRNENEEATWLRGFEDKLGVKATNEAAI